MMIMIVIKTAQKQLVSQTDRTEIEYLLKTRQVGTSVK